MTTMLQRLLKYPHAAVFDKAPHETRVLRLGAFADDAYWHVDDKLFGDYEGDIGWAIVDKTLTLTNGHDSWPFDLTDVTVQQLVDQIRAAGFPIEFDAPEFAGVPASVLLREQGKTDLDPIKAFTSLLWGLFSGYAGELDIASQQVREALRQMVIGTAEAEWLDLWGALYAVPRLPGELDAAYAARIPREAFRLRVNARGIEQAILDATGHDVRIEEPWREIFTLDQSSLSGGDKLYDGVNVGYHLIRPETRDFVDWSAVHAVIDRNRAAGVLVLQSRTERGFFVDGTGAVVTSGTVHHSRSDVINEDRALLDYMMIEDLSILNHAARRIRINLRTPSQVVVDFTGFDVAFEHARTFRSYYIRTFYEGQYWLPHVTWANADDGWSADAFLTSGHTRS